MTVSYGAPGRVNLIGEHTDYNLGFALPIALPRRTVVTFTPEHTGAITARSDRADGSARIPLDTTPGQVTGWAAYAAGAIWALRGAGHPVPGRGDVDHQRRRDRVGAFVVGGADRRGAGRGRH